MSQPARLLRLEGAAVLAGATLLYADLGASWLLFGLLMFAPDLSMLGYLAGSKVGAFTYNMAHTTLVPVTLAVLGVLLDQSGIVSVGLIWMAHIGLDRMIGYGLKYPEGFRQTHITRV